MSMIKKGKKYLLVIIDINDIYEHPIHVCDTLPECAEFLGCSVKTLYNKKTYGDFKILLVEDIDD